MTDTYRILGLAGRGALGGGAHEPFLVDIVVDSADEPDLAAIAAAAADALGAEASSLRERAERIADAVESAGGALERVAVVVNQPEASLGLPIQAVEVAIERTRAEAAVVVPAAAQAAAAVPVVEPGVAVPGAEAVLAAPVTAEPEAVVAEPAAAEPAAATPEPVESAVAPVGPEPAVVPGVGPSAGRSFEAASDAVADEPETPAASFAEDDRADLEAARAAWGPREPIVPPIAPTPPATGPAVDLPPAPAADWIPAPAPAPVPVPAWPRIGAPRGLPERPGVDDAPEPPVVPTPPVAPTPALPEPSVVEAEPEADEPEVPGPEADEVETPALPVADAPEELADDDGDDELEAIDADLDVDDVNLAHVAAAPLEATVATPLRATPTPAVAPTRRPSAQAPLAGLLVISSTASSGKDELAHVVASLRTAAGITVTDVSPLARTATGRGDLFSAVVAITTTQPPIELEAAGQDAVVGRQAEVEVLAIDGMVGEFDGVRLPLPGAFESAAVLAPWAQLQPSAVLPGLGGGPVSVLAQTAPDAGDVKWLALDWLEE